MADDLATQLFAYVSPVNSSKDALRGKIRVMLMERIANSGNFTTAPHECPEPRWSFLNALLYAQVMMDLDSLAIAIAIL